MEDDFVPDYKIGPNIEDPPSPPKIQSATKTKRVKSNISGLVHTCHTSLRINTHGKECQKHGVKPVKLTFDKSIF